MIRNNLVWRLSLQNERSDNLILLPQLLFGHADTGPGIRQGIPILTIRKFGIIVIFVSNRTVIDLFIASVANIRSFV